MLPVQDSSQKMARIEALQIAHRRNTITLKAIEIIADFHQRENEAYRRAIAVKMAEIAEIRAATKKLKKKCDAPPQQSHNK